MLSRYTINGMQVYKYILEPISSNMFIMIKNQEACVIDPHVSADADDLLKRMGVEKIYIILTHEHYDHISGVNHFREIWECVVIGNAATKEYLPNPKKNLSAFFKSMFFGKDEEIIKKAESVFDEGYACDADIGFDCVYQFFWNDYELRLVETPGHSKGSICILIDDKYIFTGDSLVDGAPIITRLPGGSKKDYLNITKPFLEQLPKDLIVFPGHGAEGELCDFQIV